MILRRRDGEEGGREGGKGALFALRLAWREQQQEEEGRFERERFIQWEEGRGETTVMGRESGERKEETRDERKRNKSIVQQSKKWGSEKRRRSKGRRRRTGRSRSRSRTEVMFLSLVCLLFSITLLLVTSSKNISLHSARLHALISSLPSLLSLHEAVATYTTSAPSFPSLPPSPLLRLPLLYFQIGHLPLPHRQAPIHLPRDRLPLPRLLHT